jgi:hypothetical protein
MHPRKRPSTIKTFPELVAVTNPGCEFEIVDVDDQHRFLNLDANTRCAIPLRLWRIQMIELVPRNPAPGIPPRLDTHTKTTPEEPLGCCNTRAMMLANDTREAPPTSYGFLTRTACERLGRRRF